MSIVILLFIAQLIFSLVIWKRWKGTREELTGLDHDHASHRAIVAVSHDRIIGVTTEGVIMCWNRGTRGMYGYTSKETLGSQISMLFDHRRGQEASRLFE